MDWIYDPLLLDALGVQNRFFFTRPWWWSALVAMLQLHIHRDGLRVLLLSSIEGSHVADEVATLVMNELCAGVGQIVRARAQQLQEEMALMLGVTLIEEEDFARRLGNC